MNFKLLHFFFWLTVITFCYWTKNSSMLCCEHPFFWSCAVNPLNLFFLVAKSLFCWACLARQETIWANWLEAQLDRISDSATSSSRLKALSLKPSENQKPLPMYVRFWFMNHRSSSSSWSETETTLMFLHWYWSWRWCLSNAFS